MKEKSSPDVVLYRKVKKLNAYIQKLQQISDSLYLKLIDVEVPEAELLKLIKKSSKLVKILPNIENFKSDN